MSIHLLTRGIGLTCAAHDLEAFANVLSGVRSLNVVFADILLGNVDYLKHQLIDIDGLNRDDVGMMWGNGINLVGVC
jgi:hypothetical protein